MASQPIISTRPSGIRLAVSLFPLNGQAIDLNRRVKRIEQLGGARRELLPFVLGIPDAAHNQDLSRFVARWPRAAISPR